MDERFHVGAVAGQKIGYARAYNIADNMIKSNLDVTVEEIRQALLDRYNQT